DTTLGYERPSERVARAPRRARRATLRLLPGEEPGPGYALQMDAIDWRAAQRIGELIAGSPPYGGLRPASVEPRAHDFAMRVSKYSGLALPAELPPLEFVDRSAWIAANLKGMRPLLGRLTDRLADDSGAL